MPNPSLRRTAVGIWATLVGGVVPWQRLAGAGDEGPGEPRSGGAGAGPPNRMVRG